MRALRFQLALVLPLLLVLAQQGAILHELGHRHAGAGSEVRYDNVASNSKLCDSCAAFEQVGNPANGAIAVQSAIAVAYHYVPEPVYSIVAADAPPPRSRGPPRI